MTCLSETGAGRLMPKDAKESNALTAEDAEKGNKCFSSAPSASSAVSSNFLGDAAGGRQ